MSNGNVIWHFMKCHLTFHEMSCNVSINDFGEKFDWKMVKSDDKITMKNKGILLQLEKKTNWIMKQDLKCTEHDEIFVKLHAHAPKDAAVNSMKTFSSFQQELKDWDKINRQKLDNNNNDYNDGLLLVMSKYANPFTGVPHDH